MAMLEVLVGSHIGQCFDLTAKREAVLGRDGVCDVVFPTKTISRRHARILQTSAGFFIEDLNSVNGTYVNGKRIAARTPLKDLDRIHLYEIVLSFYVAGKPETAPKSGEDAIQPRDEDSHFDAVIGLTEAQIAGEREKLRAVLDITRSLGSSLDIEELVPKIMDGLFEIFPGASDGHLLLAQGSQNELIPLGIKHGRGTPTGSITLRPINTTLMTQVMSAKEAVLVSDSSSENDTVMGAPTHSQICAPLIGPSRMALGVISLETTDSQQPFNREDLDVLVSVAAVAGQAIEYSYIHESRLKLDRRERELATARQVQLRLLPQRRPDIPGYRFHDFYLAADEIGGDFFGYIPLPGGRFAVAVADVVGKGLSAALTVAQLSAEVRYALGTASSATEAVSQLNSRLCELDHRFVTLVLCVLDPRNNTLIISTAGHMPPLRRRKGGEVQELVVPNGGPPLGMAVDSVYAETEVSLEPGDIVMLFTDGMTETSNLHTRELFGLNRLQSSLARAPADVEQLIGTLIADVTAFRSGGRQNDDICVVTFSRQVAKA